MHRSSPPQPLKRSPSSIGSVKTCVEAPGRSSFSAAAGRRPRESRGDCGGVDEEDGEMDFEKEKMKEREERDCSDEREEFQDDANYSPTVRNSEDLPRPVSTRAPSVVTNRNYQHSFFDPEIKHVRRLYLKHVLTIAIVMFFAMWMSLPAYWGSLAHAPQFTYKLRGFFVNRDGENGILGRELQAAFEANSYRKHVAGSRKDHMTWIMHERGLDQIIADDEEAEKNKVDEDEVEDLEDAVFDGLGYDDDEYEILAKYLKDDRELEQAVLDEEIWAAVVVNYNATQKLMEARARGDTSYDPSSAITFIYAQGRNEIAADSYIVPLTTAVLRGTLDRLSADFTAQYLSSINSMDPSSARTALENISKAPRTITTPFAFRTKNVRPYSAPVAEAVLLVGQIYILIFTYNSSTHHAHARAIIQRHLRLSSYVTMRIVVPLVLYLPVSLSYAMISLPFHMPFDAKYSYAGGFFVYWLYSYMGMAAFGLAAEAAITVLTLRFGSFFLIFLLISSLATATLPIQLQPEFYEYGYSFPIYNVSQAIRTLVFNTKNHLAQNAGVLLAWISLSSAAIIVTSWGLRWWEDNGLLWWRARQDARKSRTLRRQLEKQQQVMVTTSIHTVV